LYSPVTKTNPSALRILSANRSSGSGGFATRVFFVRPVEHRQVNRLGVNQLDVSPRRRNRSTANCASRMPYDRNDKIRKTRVYGCPLSASVDVEKAISAGRGQIVPPP
jgi:hypothetical protein